MSRFSFEEISADEVKQRLESGERLNLVDIREPFEWEATGVIPGARLAPMRPFLLGQLETLDMEEEVILICASGVRTVDAVVYMAARGFKHAKSMAGGMKGWHGPVVPCEK